jgi:DNA-binding SARP family transcriptional activator
VWDPSVNRNCRPDIAVSVLGLIRVHRSDGTPRIVGQQPLKVLAALVVAGRPLTTEDLIGRLWQTPPRTATASVHVFVNRLRKVLDPPTARASCSVLVKGRDGYELRLDPERLDLRRFEALHRFARAHAESNPSRALAAAEHAERLWRGRPFSQVMAEPWLLDEVRRLDESHRMLIDLIGELLLVTKCSEETVVRLCAAARCEPLREQRWAQLVTCLARLGRRTDATLAYEEALAAIARHHPGGPGHRLRSAGRLIDEDVPEAGSPLRIRTAAGPSGGTPRPQGPT